MTIRELIRKVEKVPSAELEIGERLKLIRNLRGFTLKDAAAEAGMHPSNLGNCENTKNRNVGSVTAIKLAKVYNCNLDWIYGLSEEVERR